MTAAEELNFILGNKPSKVAKSGNGRRGQKQARNRVYKTEREVQDIQDVQEKYTSQEPIQQPQPEDQNAMTIENNQIATEATVTETPVVEPITEQAVPVTETVSSVEPVIEEQLAPAEEATEKPVTTEENETDAFTDAVARIYTFPPLEQCFSNVTTEVKWADLAFALGDTLLTRKKQVLNSTFPSMGRMLDIKRDAIMRCYNLSDFMRFLGKTMFFAEATHRTGFTRLSFGFAKSPFEMTLTEVNDDFEISFRFKPESAIGRIALLKMEHCEILTSKDIDRALLILNAAITSFNSELILQPAVKDLIMNEVKEMV